MNANKGMRNWGQQEGCMSFMWRTTKTRDHLFFFCLSHCLYTLLIEVVGNLYGAEPDPDWNDTFKQLCSHWLVFLPYIIAHHRQCDAIGEKLEIDSCLYDTMKSQRYNVYYNLGSISR